MTFVGKVSDVAPGQLLAINVDGESVAVANVDGQLFAIGDVCTHRGCSISEGTLTGSVAVCPCHGGEYDVKSGEVLGGPPNEPVTSYSVQVSGDEFRIDQ
jgi:3-phenylpropionate/trans-cinnamate dioxygenase ferredoxin component